MEVLAEAREKGVVRTHGCSCHSIEALRTAAKTPWVRVDLARINPAPRAVFGTVFSGLVTVDALYAGLTPSLVGLYQVNVIVPPNLPDGDVNLSLAGEDYQSNIVHLPVKR